MSDRRGYGPLHGPAYPELKKRQNGEFRKVVGYLIGAGLLFYFGWSTAGFLVVGAAVVTLIFAWTYAQIENRGAQMLFLLAFLGIGGALIFVMLGAMGG